MRRKLLSWKPKLPSPSGRSSSRSSSAFEATDSLAQRPRGYFLFFLSFCWPGGPVCSWFLSPLPHPGLVSRAFSSFRASSRFLRRPGGQLLFRSSPRPPGGTATGGGGGGGGAGGGGAGGGGWTGGGGGGGGGGGAGGRCGGGFAGCAGRVTVRRRRVLPGEPVRTRVRAGTVLAISTAERALRGRVTTRRGALRRTTGAFAFSASPWTRGSRANGLMGAPGTLKATDGATTRNTFVPSRGSSAARHR
jgi:hypothetical protein